MRQRVNEADGGCLKAVRFGLDGVTSQHFLTHLQTEKNGPMGVLKQFFGLEAKVTLCIHNHFNFLNQCIY